MENESGRRKDKGIVKPAGAPLKSCVPPRSMLVNFHCADLA